MTLAMYECKKRLAVLWFLASAVICSVVGIQCILGRYDDKVNEAVGWLLPTVMPTLSLMLAVFAAEALIGGGRPQQVEQFMFRLTVGISLFYLGAVAATIFLAPFASIGPLALMKVSNLWLGPLQGLTAAALGVFFVAPQSLQAPGAFTLVPAKPLALDPPPANPPADNPPAADPAAPDVPGIGRAD